jgi:hypothetical protein
MRYTGSQPVDDHLPDVVFDNVGVFVMRRKRMPVGNEKETLVLVLEFDPVMNDSVQMTKMQTPGGTHTRQYAPLRIDGTQALLLRTTTCLIGQPALLYTDQSMGCFAVDYSGIHGEVGK